MRLCLTYQLICVLLINVSRSNLARFQRYGQIAPDFSYDEINALETGFCWNDGAPTQWVFAVRGLIRMDLGVVKSRIAILRP